MTRQWLFAFSFLVSVALAPGARGMTLVVSPSGDDTAPGTVAQPLRTIQACANLAQPGDVCSVEAGVYRETVIPPRSGTASAPIVFQAAAGACATVSGADPLAVTWSPYAGAIAVAPTNQRFIQLFSDGQALNEARWPNADPTDLVHMPRASAGFGTDPTGVVLTGAPAGDWTGAMVFMIPGQRWQSNTRQIAGYDATTGRATFDQPIMPTKVVGGQTLPETAIYPRATDPYYLYGSLLALDSPGEWFLDTSAGQLYLWPPGGVDPSTLQLETKQRAYAFDLQGLAYVEVQGFQIFGAAIRLQGTDHCTVDGVQARYVSALRETDAYETLGDVPLVSGTNNVWKNSVIAESASAGLELEGSNNLIENNIVHDVDLMVVNHGGIDMSNPDGAYQGNILAHNTVFRAARGGILLEGSQAGRALYNRVYDVALQSEDMGCIYAWGTDGAGTEIAYNELSDIGCIYGTGVYLDDFTQRFIVHHNYIHDVSWYGASFKNQNLFFDNTVLDAGVTPFMMNPNSQTGAWDAVAASQVVDNVTDDGVGFKVALRTSQITDYGDFEAQVPAHGSWAHVVVPFTSLAQPNWAVAEPLDLSQATLLSWTPTMPGSFDIRVDNVRLEGATPLLLSDFETGSSTDAMGGSFWGGSQDTRTSLVIDGPGANGSGLAAHLSGQVVVGDWALMSATLAASAGPVDLSAYTGLSFDVLATGSLNLVGDTGLSPQQRGNGACPLGADQLPTTACALDDGEAFPPFTDGFVGAAPDRGAFEAGAPRWTAGAFFTETAGSCTPPPDTSFTLPAAGSYPLGHDGGIADAGGPDAGLPDGAGAADGETSARTGGGGCSCTLADVGRGGGERGIGGAALLAAALVTARRRRRR